MFCKNCGNQMDPSAAVCISCGANAGMGASFCANCAAPVNPGAAVCLTCGAPVTGGAANGEQKSKLTAGLLALLIGGLGIHNFYLGYTTKGIIQILLTCCFGIGYIWAIVEGIMILTGSINKDAKGIPLKD